MKSMDNVHIVLIDDDADLLEVSSICLSRWYVNIHVFDNPHEALAYLQTLPDAVIVCDEDMPGLAGSQLFWQLPRRLQRRFILHTGNAKAVSPSSFLVRKPATTEEVRIAIESAIGVL